MPFLERLRSFWLGMVHGRPRLEHDDPHGAQRGAVGSG